MVHDSHAIIPPSALSAFGEPRPKLGCFSASEVAATVLAPAADVADVKALTADLSRSATLLEAVVRLWPMISSRPRTASNTLIIQILGADPVECASEQSVQRAVSPFAHWLHVAIGEEKEMPNSFHIDSLLIQFSGPNLPKTMEGKVVDLLAHVDLPPASDSHCQNSRCLGGLRFASAIFQQEEYHKMGGGVDGLPADLAIAFNAGIWGYDSWRPTIDCMCEGASNCGSPLPFVVTAYTLEECEDDAEVIADAVADAARAAVVSESQFSTRKNALAGEQIWAPAVNPFSSRLERETLGVPAGRQYFENGAWQAWLLGQSESEFGRFSIGDSRL